MGITVDFFPMKRHLNGWNSECKFPHDPGGRINCQLIKISAKVLCNLKWIHLHDFILHTRNFLHEMESKYCIMGIINENKQ